MTPGGDWADSGGARSAAPPRAVHAKATAVTPGRPGGQVRSAPPVRHGAVGRRGVGYWYRSDAHLSPRGSDRMTPRFDALHRCHGARKSPRRHGTLDDQALGSRSTAIQPGTARAGSDTTGHCRDRAERDQTISRSHLVRYT